ncbi:unnamed protein product, partial [Nesidiocoris tenuis]
MSGTLKKSSPLWSFFTVIDNEKKVARCDLCRSECSFKTTISNLRKHLKSRHPTVKYSTAEKRPLVAHTDPDEEDVDDLPDAVATTSNQARQLQKPSTSSKPSTSTQSVSVVQPRNPSELSTSKIKQTSLLSFAPPKQLAGSKKKKLDLLLLNLFTKDYQPFSIVEDFGFRKFVEELNPSYHLPNRKTISQSLLPAA